jgi:hypothetical protein
MSTVSSSAKPAQNLTEDAINAKRLSLRSVQEIARIKQFEVVQRQLYSEERLHGARWPVIAARA